jgi:hypothetical protein
MTAPAYAHFQRHPGLEAAAAAAAVAVVAVGASRLVWCEEEVTGRLDGGQAICKGTALDSHGQAGVGAPCVACSACKGWERLVL